MIRLALGLLVLAGAAASAQKSFDVASIKPNAANDGMISARMQPGGRFMATGLTAKGLLALSLGVRDFQILNAPGWAGSEHWDVNAVAEGAPARLPPEALRPMLLELLKDRLQLKMHEETKELPIYNLVVAKGGHKLKPNEEDADKRRQRMGMGRGQIRATGAEMAGLASQLGQILGREVIDKTELKGSFDFELSWTPEPGQGGGAMGGPPSPEARPAVDSSGPSIFTAVQEQLGLRLEAARGPVKIYVIDNMSRPTEN
jgi:uncharacterized protein (TIGR03435 family)